MLHLPGAVLSLALPERTIYKINTYILSPVESVNKGVAAPANLIRIFRDPAR